MSRIERIILRMYIKYITSNNRVLPPKVCWNGDHFFCSNRFHSTMIQKIYTTMSKFAKNCRKTVDKKKGLWPSECVLYANIRPLRFLTKIEFMQCYAIIVAGIIIFFKKMLWTVFFNKKHLVCSWQGLAKNNLIWFYIRLTYK